MKTRAAYLCGNERVEVRETELPDTPPRGYVRVKIEACGVCGTDVTAAQKSEPGAHPFGHEIAGVIDAIGDDVYGFEIDQRVVLESSSACGRCEVCRNGRADLCNGKALNFWGESVLGMSDYMQTPAIACVPYEGVTPEVASLAEPAGVGFDLVKTADIALGQRVCVIGPGPIALVAVALAKHRGASEVVCIGRAHSRARLAVAASLGAEIVEDTGDEYAAELHNRFDHVLVTSPVETLVPAMKLLAYGGIMTYIGIGTGSGTISFDANDFHFRKLQLRASYAAPALYFPAVIALMKAGVIPTDALISHVFPLADIAQAMHTAAHDKANAIKVIVKP